MASSDQCNELEIFTRTGWGDNVLWRSALVVTEAWWDGGITDPLLTILLSSFLSGLSDFNSIFIQKKKIGEDNNDKADAHPAWIQWGILTNIPSPVTYTHLPPWTFFAAHALKSAPWVNSTAHLLCTGLSAVECSWDNPRLC